MQNIDSRKRGRSQYKSDDSTPLVETNSICSCGVRWQEEIPPDELFGEKITGFKQFFKRSICCVLPTDFHLSKSVPETGTTNKEYPQIAENKLAIDKKSRFIKAIKGRLHSKAVHHLHGEAIKYLNKMPSCLIDECIKFDSFFRGEIEDTILWNLILKKTTNVLGDEFIFDNPKFSESIVANTIVQTLLNENYSILEVFKFSQRTTPNKIFLLFKQIVELSSCFGLVNIRKKIETTVYIYWYMINHENKFRPEYSDANCKLIIEFVQLTDNMPIKGLIQSYIYKNPVCRMSGALQDNTKYYKNIIKRQMLELVDIPPLLETKFLFGEEFEYAVPNELDFSSDELEDIDKIDQLAELNVQFNKLAKKWLEQSSLRADRLKITLTRETTEKFSNYINSFTIKIGKKFKLKIFLDGNNLEVNTTPYSYNQVFSTDGKESKSVYWFLQQFVFSIADELKLERASGHKHVDIKDSLCGNIELLVRMIVDSENQAFFPALLNRRSTLLSFEYHYSLMSSCERGLRSGSINLLVDAINSQLKSKETCLLEQGFRYKVEFVNMLNNRFIDLTYKASVCNLQHIKEDNFENSIDTPPSTTLEFRVMQAPRNAEECELINRMYIEWFKSLHKEQLRHAFLEYHPCDPESYRDRPDLAIKHFKEFLQKIKSTITDEESDKLIYCAH